MTESNYSPLGHPKGYMDADGNWITSAPSAPASIKLAVGYATADAAVLYTVPAEKRLMIEQTFWEVTTGFTGGTSSAVGVSSSQSPHNTKGDLLGGATGDVAATLVAGVVEGTPGASFSGSPGIVVLEAGATVIFDRITDAFTAGAGFVHIIGRYID